MVDSVDRPSCTLNIRYTYKVLLVLLQGPRSKHKNILERSTVTIMNKTQFRSLKMTDQEIDEVFIPYVKGMQERLNKISLEFIKNAHDSLASFYEFEHNTTSDPFMFVRSACENLTSYRSIKQITANPLATLKEIPKE